MTALQFASETDADGDPNGFTVLLVAVGLFAGVQIIRWIFRWANPSMTDEETSESWLWTLGKLTATALIAIGAVIAISNRIGG